MTYKVKDCINLQKVNKKKKDIELLYGLLRKRKINYNISKKKMPTMEEHREFVLNHPYRIWFFIKDENQYIGSLYLSNNNEIGIYLDLKLNYFENIISFIKKKYPPLEEIKSVRTANYVIHTSPKNKKYMELIKKMGGKLVQNTFILE